MSSDGRKVVRVSVEDFETDKKKSYGKLYKQKYRKEWEKIPVFKGWLCAIPNQPTQAYCKFCKTTLHAHRLTLLKHTCTAKHEKKAKYFHKPQNGKGSETTAQESVTRGEVNKTGSKETVIVYSKGKKGKSPKKSPLDANSETQEPETDISFEADKSIAVEADKNTKIEPGENTTVEANKNITVEPDKNNTVIADIAETPTEMDHNVTVSSERDMNSSNEISDGEVSNSGTNTCEEMCVNTDEVESQDIPLAINVYDTAKGSSVSGVLIYLYKLVNSRWQTLNEGLTDPFGDCKNLVERKDFLPGRYKVHVDTGRYYELRNIKHAFPYIEIVFDTKYPEEKVEIPLLLTPFGYNVYQSSSGSTAHMKCCK